MVDRETVDRFQLAVDCGRVYGPYANRTGEKDGYARRDFYLWVATKEDRFEAAHLLYPLLSTVRRQAIDLHYGELAPVSL